MKDTEMAQNAPQIQFRQEYIKGFEQRQSLLRQSTTTEAVIKGNQAYFLVADSGGAVAVTRGLNGYITPRSDNLTQNPCTLVEYHDLVQRTGFNLFESQGDGKRIMMDNSMGVIGRIIDRTIVTELSTATQDTGAPSTNVRDMAIRAQTILGNNSVPLDGRITLLVTPGFRGNMLKLPEFTNNFYVTNKPYENGGAKWTDEPTMYRWLDMNVIVHPNLPGVGTANEACFMYHVSSIGSAANIGDMSVTSGTDDEQDYSWVHAKIYTGAKLLQNSGVVVLYHDASAFIAE